MNLYLTAAGVYAGTQKDAGKGHRAVEVPTDKAGLIAYLNSLGEPPVSLAQAIKEAQELVDEVRDEPLPAPTLVPAVRPTPAGAFRLRLGDEASQISDWVLDAPGSGVVTVLGACVERIERMGRAA
jgi:hypothetical protein